MMEKNVIIRRIQKASSNRKNGSGKVDFDFGRGGRQNLY